MTAAIHDFLLPPHPSDDAWALRRTDLAVLRQYVRHPEGLGSGNIERACAVHRLWNAGLVYFGDAGVSGDFASRWFATAYGLATARANASCRDGSETQPHPPAYFRGLREDGNGANPEADIIAYEKRLCAERGLLTHAMSETLPPPPAAQPSVAAGPGRRSLLGIGWLGRQVAVWRLLRAVSGNREGV